MKNNVENSVIIRQMRIEDATKVIAVDREAFSIYQKDVTTDKYGVATYSFTLDSESELGTYQIVTQKDEVRQILSDRKYRANRPRTEGLEILIQKESRGWLYDFDTKQIEDIVWEVPPKIDPSTIKLMRYGSCPFAYGESKSLKPPFIRTLLRPSEGFVFYKEFNIKNPSKYEGIILKVASCNAAAVYMNGVLIDEDPMIKLKDGHDYEYWNRIREDVPLALLKTGTNTITVFLGNDKSTSDGYFDMALEAIRKGK